MSDIEDDETLEVDSHELIPIVRNLTRKEINAQYNESYFDGGEDSVAYRSYTDSWLWASITEIMIHLLGPGSVLDWGCAKGYLVQRFAERGVNGCGVDVSEYAVQQATPWVRDHRLRVINGVSTPFGKNSYDTVCSFETMEHIPKEDLPAVLKEMRRISRRWWFGSIFIEGQESNDPTHITVKSREWWNQLFKEHGYRVREDIAKAAMEYPVFQAIGFQVFCFEQIGWENKG